MASLFREFVTGADSFGQLSNGISNSIISGIVYWLIAAIVMGILFLITGLLIVGIGYQVGKIWYSDKPHCTVTSGAFGLYWNPMLCERLAGRTGTLLKNIHYDYKSNNTNSVYLLLVRNLPGVVL